MGSADTRLMESRCAGGRDSGRVSSSLMDICKDPADLAFGHTSQHVGKVHRKAALSCIAVRGHRERANKEFNLKLRTVILGTAHHCNSMTRPDLKCNLCTGGAQHPPMRHSSTVC